MAAKRPQRFRPPAPDVSLLTRGATAVTVTSEWCAFMCAHCGTEWSGGRDVQLWCPNCDAGQRPHVASCPCAECHEYGRGMWASC